ncbi:MAG: PqqD family protein [Prevotella sp.]|nr:PqqD family protein [Prevotella sp.]
MEPLANHYVVAVKEKDTGLLVRTLTTDDNGAEIIKLLQMETSVSDTAKEIAARYNVSPDVVLADVEKLVALIED